MIIKWINSLSTIGLSDMNLEYEDFLMYPTSALKSIENHIKLHPNSFEEKEQELILELINSKEKSNAIIAFEIINQKPEINI